MIIDKIIITCVNKIFFEIISLREGGRIRSNSGYRGVQRMTLSPTVRSYPGFRDFLIFNTLTAQ